MPMKKGHSKEIVSSNIKEMVKSGYKPKQAIAASLASARKYKKMADGGMVDLDDDADLGTNNSEDAQRSLAEIQDQGDYHPEKVTNPEEQAFASKLAKALYKKSEEEGMMNYAEGGLVEPMYEDEMLGNKPSEDMMDGSEEPMGDEPMEPQASTRQVPDSNRMGLSEDAIRAIEERKAKRRRMMGQ